MAKKLHGAPHYAPTVLALAGLLILSYLLYWPGESIPPHFDDIPNLQGLTEIEDKDSALLFIANGHAGPLGRPLALASFLINGNGWPDSVPEMRRVNHLIHLLNGVLLFYLGYLISIHALGRSPRQATSASLILCALWLFSPLLTTTNLMLVQRMTSLSATFVLTGLIIYLLGRQRLRYKPKTSFLLMSLGIGLGTLLAMFTKENGILLPVYALSIEFLLQRSSSENLRAPTIRWEKAFQNWKLLFLWVPLLAIIVYLFSRIPDLPHAYRARDYNATERLMSEARILWDYLRITLIPRTTDLTPFTDAYPPSRGLFSPWQTALSIAAWVTLIAFAVFKHRQHPLLFFSVSWYLGGHLLESTIIPLELYFLHRNYLPIIGPMLAATQLPFILPRRHFRPVLASFLAVLGLHYFISYQSISLWRSPLLAAEIWHLQHPRSLRAVQYLSQQYLEQGWVEDSYKVIDDGVKHLPTALSLRIQRLKLACPLNFNRERLETLLTDIYSSIPGSSSDNSLPVAVAKLVSMWESNECGGLLTSERLLRLIDTLLENPVIMDAPHVRAGLMTSRARLYTRKGELNSTIQSMETAFEATLNPSILGDMSLLLASAGLLDEASGKLSMEYPGPSWNLLKKWVWEKTLEKYRSTLFPAQEYTSRNAPQTGP